MNQRIAAIALGVLALMVGAGVVAHYASPARASQPAAAAAAPATPVAGNYVFPVAPAAAVPTSSGLTPNALPGPGLSGVPAVTPNATVPMATPVAAEAAAGTPVAYRERVVYRTRTVRARPRYYVHNRSKGHSAMIIGGSTLGGAGIGALVGGKKGALIGGLVGGAAGTVYDRKTHRKVVRE